MIVSLVVAMSDNNAIGKNNQLIWHLPADLKHFKKVTSGHTIIMGRKTYDSIGKPLPNRKNVVITRNPALEIAGVTITSGLEEALSLDQEEDEVFVIGGAEIFKQALPLASRIYLTRVHATYEADTFFPEIDPERWIETEKEAHLPDAANPVSYTFSTLQIK